MPEHEDFYTPSRIDEQIDALLQGEATPIRDQRMADDLLTILEHENENARSLQKVLYRLLGDSDTQPTGIIIPLSGRQQQGRSPGMRTYSNLQPARKTRPVFRVWSTLAAVLIVATLVGSMLAILNAQRQPGSVPASPQKSATTPPQKPTPTPREGQIVYKSQNVALSMPLAWSPDGKRVATAINRTEVQSWDALTGENVVTYPINGDTTVGMVAWSPDGKSLAVAGNTHVSIFNAQSAEQLLSLSPAQSLSASTTDVPLSALLPRSGGNTTEDVAWSPDGRYLSASVWGLSSGISVWDAHTGQLIKHLTGSYSNNVRAIWQPHGHLLAVLKCYMACSTSTAELWDVTTWQVVKQYSDINALDWSPNGHQLALVDATRKSVHIVDALTGQQTKKIADPQALSLSEIRWSPDGSRLVLDAVARGNASSHTVSIWNVTGATQVYRSLLDGSYYSSWSPDSKYIANIQTVQTKVNNKPVYSTYIVVWVA